MAKKFDFILSRIIMFTVFVLILLAFVPVIWYNLAISAAATILISLIIKVLSGKSAKHINYKSFELFCITQGIDYILQTISVAMPSYNFIQGDGVLLGKYHEKDIAIIPSIKFGAVGNDEVLKLHLKAKSLGVDKIYFVAREIDRKCQLIMHNYSKEVVFVPLSVIFKMLKGKKILPAVPENIKIKRNLSTEIFNIIFARVNVKRYLFVATVLFLMSLLIPFKIYYITLGVINVVLAIVCMLRTRSQSYYGKYGMFDEQLKTSSTSSGSSSNVSKLDNDDFTAIKNVNQDARDANTDDTLGDKKG